MFVLYATEWTDKIAMKERIHEVISAVGFMEKNKDLMSIRWRTTTTSFGTRTLHRPELIIADEPLRKS